MKKALSPPLIEDIYRLSVEGRSHSEIASTIGLSRLQVSCLLAHRKLAVRPDQAGHAQQAVEPEILFDDTDSLDETGENHVDKSEPVTRTGIYVGDERGYDEQPANWDPADSRHVQNPHLMVMGESGSGKTYALQCLVAELALTGVPSIIFDYGQSFEADKLEPAFLKYCSPIEHRIGEEGLALNPLEIFQRDTRGPNSVATRLADVFDAAYRLGDIQKKVLIEAVLESYRAADITVDRPDTWSKQAPSISDLRDVIEHLAADRATYPNHRNAAGLSARLMTFFMLASFRADLEPWSWERLITSNNARVHVLQFRGLEGKTQRVLVELLLWHFFYHLKSIGQSKLRLFCVLDEAHHLSFRENGPLAGLLREARKFGLGVIFASQQPEDFSPVAYSNSATKLIFQTADSSQRVSKFLCAKLSNYDQPSEIQDVIARLAQGEALFITRNRGYRVHVADFPKRTTLWSE